MDRPFATGNRWPLGAISCQIETVGGPANAMLDVDAGFAVDADRYQTMQLKVYGEGVKR